MSGELTCQELVELVTNYLEGALPSVERDRFEKHLASCANCHRYLDQMRYTIAAVGQISEDSLAPEMKMDLLHAFRTWRRT
jgi:anti-sigma factor RsiW